MKTKKTFIDQLAPSQLSWVFECFPEICFFAKNLEGQFVLCNSSTLKLFGFTDKKEFLGKTDLDIFSEYIAKTYMAMDQKVIDSKKPILNIIEPVPDSKRKLKWFSTNKIPLFDCAQHVIGVAVFIRDITHHGALLGSYEKLTKVIEVIFKDYQDNLSIPFLAEVANMSTKQLERQFQKLFGTTPLRFIHEHRILLACQKLLQTEDDIAEIGKSVGYYDHPHFIRIFKSIKKTTPSKYRKAT